MDPYREANRGLWDAWTRINLRSEMYDVESFAAGRGRDLDVVFTSHGVLGWLPDLERWAQIVARYLAPGGVFYIVGAHSILMCFDDRLTARLPQGPGSLPLMFSLKATRDPAG
jgi:SAM-dependent methyltransferase